MLHSNSNYFFYKGKGIFSADELKVKNMNVKCINVELSQDVSVLLLLKNIFTARISFSLQFHSVGGKTPCSFLVLVDARNCKNIINIVW